VQNAVGEESVLKVLSAHLHTLRQFKLFNMSEAAGIHGTFRRLQYGSDNRKENPFLSAWQQPGSTASRKGWLYFCIVKGGVWTSFRSLYAPEKGKASFETAQTVMG